LIFFEIILIFSYLFSFSIGIGMFNTFEFQSKVFFYFLSLTLLVQLVLLFFYINKMNNILFMNIYLFVIISYHIFLSSYVFKHYKLIGILITIGILFLFYWEGINTFNIHAFIICTLLVCIIHSILILKLVKEDDLLFSNPQFYISAGLLIFMFSMSAPLLLMNYMVIHNFKIIGKYYTVFSSCVTIIANLFYIKAFLCSKKQIS
jgi:hypothetical protein